MNSGNDDKQSKLIKAIKENKEITVAVSAFAVMIIVALILGINVSINGSNKDTLSLQTKDAVKPYKSLTWKSITTTSTASPVEATTTTTAPPVSIGKINAVKSAKLYIEYSGFSYKRLIEQLEYEKFTHEEAVYGADNCGADWNEEAKQSAESYLLYLPFSRSELIEQLEYEGFTHEQVEYAVRAVGYEETTTQAEDQSTQKTTTAPPVSVTITPNLPSPIEYSGYGDDVITGISVPDGLYRVVLTNNADGHFSAVTYNEFGDYEDLLANSAGAYYGATVYRDGSFDATENWSIKVTSNGDWNILIEPINQEISSCIKGHGDTVTGLFEGDGFSTVTITNSGDEHFSIVIYDSKGKYLDLLVNESGAPYSGKNTFRFDRGEKYFLQICSGGDWYVDFGQGAAETIYGY